MSTQTRIPTKIKFIVIRNNVNSKDDSSISEHCSYIYYLWAGYTLNIQAGYTFNTRVGYAFNTRVGYAFNTRTGYAFNTLVLGTADTV